MSSKIDKLRLPCTAYKDGQEVSCGSSDGMALYSDGSKFCHACQTPDNRNRGTSGTKRTKGNNLKNELTPEHVDLSFYYEAAIKGIPERKIPEDVCRKYGVRTTEDGNHLFPGFNDTGELVAVKRCIPEIINSQGDITRKKSFVIKGPWSSCTLFGANEFPKTGISITVVEGEYDALAAYKLTGSKYPYVSILNGASSARKDMENNYDYLREFQTVVLNMDNDPPGKKATEACAPLFPGKTKYFHLTEGKDACDYLLQNKAVAYVSEFWKAKRFTLGGIINAADTLEALFKKKATKSIPWPDEWEELNNRTYGLRLGELVLVTSGTGCGKTQFLRELKYFWLTKCPEYKTMDISLEEDSGDVAGGLVSLAMNERIMLPDVPMDKAVVTQVHSDLFSEGRMLMLDHAGSFGDDSLLGKIEYAVTVEKCSLICLDHITIAVSDHAPGQENTSMDSFMNRLLKLVKRLPVCIVIVSHLRKTPGSAGQTFESGRVPCEDDLKGSGSLKQIVFTTIAMARNKYADDERERNTTSLHVLKCRFSGKTGPAGFLYFNETTGRLIKSDGPEEDDNEFGDLGALGEVRI